MNLTDRVRALFVQQPNEWIDGRQLAKVGGYAGWRTRLSECRRRYAMQIENRVIYRKDYRITRYRYTPHVGKQAA